MRTYFFLEGTLSEVELVGSKLGMWFAFSLVAWQKLLLYQYTPKLTQLHNKLLFISKLNGFQDV